MSEATDMQLLTGSFLFQGGSRYEGQYLKKADGSLARQGYGTLKDGPETYAGEWSDDKMNGKGVYVFATGAKYEGDFKDNNFDGVGQYKWSDGAVYTGGWRLNKMHGDGLYIDADNAKWKGAFFNGKYNNGTSFVTLR